MGFYSLFLALFIEESYISITLEYSKIAPLTYPYLFYLEAFVPSSIEQSLIIFWLCLHNLSYLFSHFKSENSIIKKLFSSAFRKCIHLAQIKSQVTNNLRICWTKKGPKWAGLDFSRTVNLNFPK